MRSVDLSKLTPDPLTKAIAESIGETVAVSGYVRSVTEDTIAICEDPTSRSYIEYPRSSIAVAFIDDDESTKVTLLVACVAEVRVVRLTRLSGSTGVRVCECSDVGVQEARPYGSIDSALGEFMDEIWAMKAAMKESSGRLKCDLERHGRIIRGEDPDKVDLEYRNCRLGFPSEDSSPGRPF